MFNSRRKDLNTFIQKLEFKLEQNADRYLTKRARLLYAHSRLEYDLLTLVVPLIDQDIRTVEHLVQFLRATYSDLNKKLIALSKLHLLKQGKRAFTTHFAKFRRLAVDTSLNKISQITQLRHSLSDKLCRAIVGVPIPEHLNDYANLISAYDNNLRFLPTSRYPRYQPYTKRDPNAIEINAFSYALVRSAEREDRCKKGLCYKCSKKGHLSLDYSVPLPYIRSSSLPSSRQTSPRASNRTPPRSPTAYIRRASILSALSTNSKRSRGRRSLSNKKKPLKALSRG